MGYVTLENPKRYRASSPLENDFITERPEDTRPGTVSSWPVLDKLLDGVHELQMETLLVSLTFKDAMISAPFSADISLHCVLQLTEA